MNHDDQLLKHACNMVMDAFDDAVLTVPGTKSERIVALVDVLLPRLIDRAAEAGAINDNHDLDAKGLAAFMQLLRKCIEETQGCQAALLVRIKTSGEVMVAGSSTGLRDEFLQEIGGIVKTAVYGWSSLRATNGGCGCPACVAKRAAQAHMPKGTVMPFTGPKAEA